MILFYFFHLVNRFGRNHIVYTHSESLKMLTILIKFIVKFFHDIFFSAWHVSNYFISAYWTHIASFNERKLLAYAFMCFEREGDFITCFSCFFSTLFNILIFVLIGFGLIFYRLSGIILFPQVKFFEWLFVLRARWTYQLFIGA